MQPTSRFTEALRHAEQLGHELKDEPSLFVGRVRKSCRRCGRIVVGSVDIAYGSALKEPCTRVSRAPRP